MSLNPASYLQTWEQNLAAAHHRYRGLHAESESDTQDEPFPDLPESSSSSASFLSRFSHDHRLNFYPYADDRVPNDSRNVSPIRGLATGVQGDRIAGLNTIAAYEVTLWKRIAQVFVAMISCFLTSGVIYGFAALKPVLIKEGVYASNCSTEEILARTLCYGQELRLNLMFAIATGTVNTLIIPAGAVLALIFPVRTILNSSGPSRCSITGSFSLILGTLLLAFASDIPFDAYVPGYLFLSLGGSLIFISSLHLMNAFPTYSTLIFLAITGAFNSSSAVFLIFRLINEQTDGRFSTRIFFLVYLIAPILIIVTQLTIMPNSSYKTTAELLLQADAYSTTETYPDPVESDSQHICRENAMRNIQLLLNDTSNNLSKTRNAVFGSGPSDPGYIPQIQPPRSLSKPSPSGILQEYSLPNQIFSAQFLLMGVFTFMQVLKANYFIASLRQQYEYLLSPEQGRTINQVFDILFPIGGIISVPFTNTLLNHTNLPFILALLVSLSTIHGIINSIPTLWTGYASTILYVFYRPFLFASISGYVVKALGFRTYAIGYGILVSLAGLGNFVIPGLDALTIRVLRGSPAPVDGSLTVVSLVVGVLLVWLVWSSTRYVGGHGDEEGCLVQSNEVPCIEDEAGSEEDLERGPLLHGQHGEMRRYGSTDMQDDEMQGD